MVKRCFACGAKEDGAGHCTNAACPRYQAVSTETKSDSSTGDK